MTLILKQSTSIKIRVGPFVDATDGVSPEVGITLAGADQAEVLKFNGAATAAMAGAFVAVTGADGWYDYTVATGDVDTVGEVVFVVQDSSVALPVFVRGQVVEEAVYDTMYLATSIGPLQGTTAGRTLDIAATGEVALDFGATIGTLDAAQFGADFLTAAKIADGAFLAVNFAASSLDGKGDWNIGKTGYALTTADWNVGKTGYSIASGGIGSGAIAAAELTNIENGIWNALKSAHTTPNSFGDFLDIEVSGRQASGAVDLNADQSGVTIGTLNALAANVITAAAINAAAFTAAKFATDAIDANALATDAVNEIRDAILPKKNTALSNIEFLFVAASDHVTPVTGATGSAVTRSIDGGAFGAGTGTLAEVANGIYQYDASQADMNGTIITFRFVATGGTPGAPDDTFLTIRTGG